MPESCPGRVGRRSVPRCRWHMARARRHNDRPEGVDILARARISLRRISMPWHLCPASPPLRHPCSCYTVWHTRPWLDHALQLSASGDKRDTSCEGGRRMPQPTVGLTLALTLLLVCLRLTAAADTLT